MGIVLLEAPCRALGKPLLSTLYRGACTCRAMSPSHYETCLLPYLSVLQVALQDGRFDLSVVSQKTNAEIDFNLLLVYLEL